VRRGATRLAAARPGRLTEIRLSPGSGAVALRPLAKAAIDFPVVNEAAPSPRRHVYAAGYRQETAAYRDLFDAVLKIDATTGAVEKVEFGAGHFVSEAAFAPAPGGVDEDDGWLLTVNYDATADDSYLAVLSAAGRPRILARLSLGQALPMSFHGLWEPAP
ncbi:MAG: carotenoid oxygenase family protein, partial [Pseudomonadota bacterium]